MQIANQSIGIKDTNQQIGIKDTNQSIKTTDKERLPLFRLLIDEVNEMKMEGKHIPSLNEMLYKLKDLNKESKEIILALMYSFDESKACLPIPCKGRYDSGNPNMIVTSLGNKPSVSFSIPHLPAEIKEIIAVFLMKH